jgi:hypothetical protein
MGIKYLLAKWTYDAIRKIASEEEALNYTNDFIKNCL